MDIRSAFSGLGLGDKEADVYLSLAEHGPASVRMLAERTGINRGTVYNALKALSASGLAAYFHKASKQYFAAEPPERMLAALDERSRKIGDVKQQIESALPELSAVFSRGGGRPVVRFYEGAVGVRRILEEVLGAVGASPEKLYYVYSSASVRKDVHRAMPEFSRKRVARGIRVKTIALGPGGTLMGLDERRWLLLPKESRDSTYGFIYAGRVAFVSLDDGQNPVGVVVQNDALYETQKAVFEHLWNTLPA